MERRWATGLILLIGSFLVGPLLAEEIDLEQKVATALSTSVVDPVNITSPEVQAVVLQRLKENLSDPEKKESARMSLLLLNDSDTVKKTVADFHGGDANSGKLLGYLAGPSVIPYVAQDMLTGSTFPKSKGEPSERTQAIEATLMILRRSSELPVETSAWADKIYHDIQTGNPDAMTQASQLMQAWWAHNGQALLAHRADQATWLPDTNAPAVTPVASAPDPEGVNATSLPISRAPASLPSPTLASVADTNPAATANTNWLIPAFLLAVTVGLAICLFQMFGTQPKRRR